MNASTSLKADLLRPEAYPALRASRVELAETHVSQVMLLERDVYKVKRPVDLGFLDFTTLQRREAACRAEVALNARLAPDVYLGVVPVRRAADGHAGLLAEGPIVDWAVHMRRLPDERRADVMLAREELGGAEIDAIAARLARFHTAAATDAHIAGFGHPDAITRNVEENFAQTSDAMKLYAPDEAPEIVRWQTAFLRGHRALFERRAATGRVRDGHGDLRLEHVYLEDDPAKRGEPTIIDCIEFNERFRYADVCADVAFLSMDLEAHGRVDLAERLLARYAREAGDFDLYALVDFYESYRAFVRAKVSAMLAVDPDVAPEVRTRATSEARRHFLLALAADRGSLLRPAVVAVGGIIASGKSTIAERLADEMGAPVVDADRTRKAMVGVDAHQPIHDGAWAGAYDPGFTEGVYAEVLRRAEVVVASGRPVIVDASFRSLRLREAARQLANRCGVPFRFVECRADADVCRARLSARERSVSVSDGRLSVFDAFRARFEPVTELCPTEHVVLDTARPIEESLRVLRAHLDTWPLGFVA
jgi:aminoglycoside phosphotransferase family enzyme/predicted kinase